MLNDFRFAFRQLWKTPGFTLAAVIVLALGIGVNTAIFSLVNATLFSPLPYKNPAEIVQLFSQNKKDKQSFRAFSYPTFSDVRAQNTVFSDVMAHRETVVGLGEKGNTRRAPADLVSSNYFSVLGVRPAYGRSFLPEEEKPGRTERVAIVSHRYWKKHSRDPALLGHTLLINGRDYTVIGILPKGLTETESIFSAEVWLPLGVYDEIMNDLASAPNHSSLDDRSRDNLIVIGRLKPGITAAAAEPALKGLAANLERGVSGRAKRSDLHDVAARSIFQRDRALGARPGLRHRNYDHRDGRRGFARRLFEPRQHVARSRDGASERDRDPPRARWQPWPNR